MTKSRFSTFTAILAAACFVLAGCGGSGDGESKGADSSPADLTQAGKDAQSFYTVSQPDDWNNYGAFWQGLCDENDWDCNGYSSTGPGAGENRTNNDDASSADVISEFLDKNSSKNPVCGDIGIAFASALQEQNAGLKYVPKGAENLPDSYHGSDDSWWSVVAGVPTFLVNTDEVKNPPKSWADLAKPEYKGLIAIKDPTESGTGQAMVLAAASAFANGDGLDLDAAMTFFGKLQAAGQFNPAGFDEATFESGETPIFIGYDFTSFATQKALKEAGVGSTVTVPTDGSIFAPSVMPCNANTKQPDLAKAALDFAFSDKGQEIFAEIGAHPIRYVTGDLELPDSAKKNWLPDEEYEKAATYEGGKWPSAAEIAQRWNEEVINQ